MIAGPWRGSNIHVFVIWDLKIVATIQLKKHIVVTSILCIIIGKSNYQKKSSLIVLLIIHKNLQINAFTIKLLFSLAISLS